MRWPAPREATLSLGSQKREAGMTNTPNFLKRNLTAATFRDCAMASSVFDDVALPGATLTNVDLSQARLRNVNLTGVTIDDAAIKGLTVLGYDVNTLIQREEAQATPQTREILSAEPQIFVSDMEAALRFYVGQGGFDIVFTYGEPPFYGQVVRGSARLNLRVVTGRVFDHGFRDREADALAATLTSADVDALFLEYEAAGVAFHQRLRSEPWGARTFIAKDPDGNLLAFASASG